MAIGTPGGVAALAWVFLLSTGAFAAEGIAPAPDEAPSAAQTGLEAAGADLPNPLSLVTALAFARTHHPDLRIARAGLAVARAESTHARVHPFNPELSLGVTRGGATLGSGTDGALDLGVSQVIEIWGKRGSRTAVATARTQTAAAEVAARTQEIESALRAEFQRTMFLQDRLELLTELSELDRRVASSAQARVRDGSITPLTGRLSDLDYLRTDVQRRQSQTDLRQARGGLGLALGAQLPDTIRLDGVVQADSLALPEQVVVEMALRSRRQHEVFLKRLDERRAEMHLADVDGRPNVTLGAGLSIERRAFGLGDFSGDPTVVNRITGARDTERLWRAGLTVPLPLWQRNQTARARAAAELVRAQSEYDGFIVRTRLEALAAIRRFLDVTQLYRIYLDRSARVHQDLALVRDAYMDGRIPLDSYLAEKGRLVDTLLGQLEAGEAYWDARGDLESVVGADLERINEGGRR